MDGADQQSSISDSRIAELQQELNQFDQESQFERFASSAIVTDDLEYINQTTGNGNVSAGCDTIDPTQGLR